MVKKQIDYILLGAVLLLVALGLVFVYSASYYSAQITYNNKYFFLTKQAIGAVIGLVSMLVLSRINLQFVKKMWIVGVIISVVLLCLVFVPGIGAVVFDAYTGGKNQTQQHNGNYYADNPHFFDKL